MSSRQVNLLVMAALMAGIGLFWHGAAALLSLVWMINHPVQLPPMPEPLPAPQQKREAWDGLPVKLELVGQKALITMKDGNPKKRIEFVLPAGVSAHARPNSSAIAIFSPKLEGPSLSIRIIRDGECRVDAFTPKAVNPEQIELIESSGFTIPDQEQEIQKYVDNFFKGVQL